MQGLSLVYPVRMQYGLLMEDANILAEMDTSEKAASRAQSIVKRPRAAQICQTMRSGRSRSWTACRNVVGRARKDILSRMTGRHAIHQPPQEECRLRKFRTQLQAHSSFQGEPDRWPCVTDKFHIVLHKHASAGEGDTITSAQHASELERCNDDL